MGEVLTLDDMLLEHVQKRQLVDHGWDDNLLHLSDIGKCPRQTMKRIIGDAKRELVGEELRKKTYMFYLANYIHDEMYAAWAEQGILIEKECNIRGYLPPGWTGRFDAILDYRGGPRITDVKTKAYLGKTSQLPDIEHMFQVISYHMFVEEAWCLQHNPLLFYIQRDLQHYEAQEKIVDITEASTYYVKSQMKELEEVKSRLPELPPILPREIKYTGKKVKGQYMELSAVMPKACTTEWCDYSGGSCEPDVGEDLVAWRNGDDWVYTDIGEEHFMDAVVDFLTKEQMDEYAGS